MTGVRDDAPWTPVEHRVHPPDQRPGLGRRRLPHGVRRELPGPGPRRRLPRRARSRRPLDPRHRLVTTKYNPARTWTAENSVGIGGAYLCIYGMEGPGGYQFVGRTVQIWNRFRRGGLFAGAPVGAALLRPDRVVPGLRRGAARAARRDRRGRGCVRDATRARSRSPSTRRFLGRERRRRSPTSGRAKAARSRRRRNAGAPRASSTGVDEARPPARLAGRRGARRGRTPVYAPFTSTVWQVAVEAGATVAAGGRPDAVRGGDEDGDEGGRTGQRDAWWRSTCSRASRSRPGRSSRRSERWHDRGLGRTDRLPRGRDAPDRRLESRRPSRGVDHPAHPWTRCSPRQTRSTRVAAGERLPLAGLTVAVKDNIDVAGLPTTAGAPSYAYRPDARRDGGRAAAGRGRGRARQDQPRPVRDRPGRHAHARTARCATRGTPPRISGGSSSGSAVAVALGDRRLRARHRHRRVRAGPGGAQRDRRGQADARAWSRPRASCRRAARSTA